MAKELIINVLYVDDEDNNLISFTATFRKKFNVFTAISAQESDTILANHNIHVLITDQRMPVKGTELLVEVAKKYPNPTRIMLTAYAEDADVKESEKNGYIDGIVEKPFDQELLEEFIEEGYNLFLQNIEQQQRIFKLKNFDKNSKK